MTRMAALRAAVPASSLGGDQPEPRPRGRPAAPASADEECVGLRTAIERAVRRVCPRWLAAEADDIVQAALLRVLAAHDGRPLAAAYLWRAAYTATVDEIRRQRRRREVSLEDVLRPEAYAGPEAPVDPERTLRGREIARGLGECLRCLVEPRRMAVALHLQGHGVKEAADILGWADKRVENLVYRGLFDLRRCLAAKGLVP